MLAPRGYIGTGIWTPQFMLEYPEVLTGMHYEFVHCGSDVVQALQVSIWRPSGYRSMYSWASVPQRKKVHGHAIFSWVTEVE